MKKKSLGAINSLGLAKPRHLNLAPLVEFRYPTRVIKNGSVKISYQESLTKTKQQEKTDCKLHFFSENLQVSVSK